MNLFKSLFGKQDPSTTEIVKLPAGQLYLVRPGNIRSSRECIYNEAMATVRRVQNVEHNFQLVVTRVFEEGDQELLEDDDETDDERDFLITKELEFRPGKTDGEASFVWRDLQGDVDELYEFVTGDSVNEPTRQLFQTCMYRAMYERKYKNVAETDDDLLEFIWQPPSSKTAPRKSASARITDLDSDAPSIASLTSLVKAEGKLFRWLPEQRAFEDEGPVIAQIQKSGNGFAYWLTASSEGGTIIFHRVIPEMNQKLSWKLRTLTWNHMGSDGSLRSWLILFPSDKTVFEEIVEKFTEGMWETLHQMPYGKLKPDEQAYVMSSTTEDVEMKDVEADQDEDEVMSELNPEEEESEEEDEYASESDSEIPQEVLDDRERNSSLTVGYKDGKSYVVRGDKIGVFDRVPGKGIKFKANIKNLRTPKGKAFTPHNVMLHDQDTKMILMNPTEHNSLYSMDIERGQVVEEWKVHDDIEVNHIAPENKFAPTTREQTLVGASQNGLFRIDPRVSGTKLVESAFKQYASKNKFSGVATTAKGKLAVSSEKGDIRLFDTIGKNAKTALPPLGDPIVGIDTTADGRYLIATTKTYLLLIDTLIGDGKNAGAFGFDKPFPADAKPIPKRLRLSPQHAAYMNHDISFTPARFNQGEDLQENAIVTSTGQYVIAWDFAKVKKGQLDKYDVKKYNDHVVQDNFRFGDDKEIVVALDNNVLSVNKAHLRKPTRASLSTPTKSLSSKSNIVNAPY